MSTFEQQFIEFCINSKVLRFGEFKTKAGRLSPYFFNAGLFNTGSLLRGLSDYYARTLLNAIKKGEVKCDMIFGPAYKGIPLAAAVAMRLSELGLDLPYSYNRKEKKDHGEGGVVVGAPLQGNVVIIDDVISAGTSVGESVDIIKANGANPSAVLIALDRKEKSGTATDIGAESAVQHVQKDFGIPVVSIASLDDLLGFLESSKDESLNQYKQAIEAYRAKYGA